MKSMIDEDYLSRVVVGGDATGEDGGVGVVRSGSAGGVTLSPSLAAHAGTRG